MQQFICNRIHDVSTEAMKIIMNYFYDNKFEKEGISRKCLEEVLILAHFFVLEGLIWLATDHVIHMIDNPRFWSFYPRDEKLPKN